MGNTKINKGRLIQKGGSDDVIPSAGKSFFKKALSSGASTLFSPLAKTTSLATTATGLGAVLPEKLLKTVGAPIVNMGGDTAKAIGFEMADTKGLEGTLLQGTFRGIQSNLEKEEFWELLYDEPCFIDPNTQRFELKKLGYLWCNWVSETVEKGVDNVVPSDNETKVDVVGAIKAVAEATGETPAQEAVAAEIEKLSGKGEEHGLDKEKARDAAGNINEAVEGIVAAVPGANAGEVKQALDTNIQETSTSLTALADPMGGAATVVTTPAAGSAGNVSTGCKWKKFQFCLWMKFLLGPGGYLLLKILPHFFKFIITVINLVLKILYSTANTVVKIGSLGFGSGIMEMTYENEKGEEETYYPTLIDVVLSYLGTVIPFQFYSYDHGEKYGKGKFGKLIVTFVFISIGIIVVGGLGVSLLLIGFVIYLFKIIGMFSDNIKDKKKAK